jgi:hypothetical protein
MAMAEVEAVVRFLPEPLTIEISTAWVIVHGLVWLICRPRT